MRIVHYNNIDFIIGEDGQIVRNSTWHLMPDASFDIEGSWPTFQADVETWAGKPGGNWRKPDANSQGYTEDDSYLVTNISCKSTARYMYEVTFTGRKKHLTAEMVGGISESINNCAESVKTAKWLIHADSLADWLPAIGAVIAWAGEFYLCEDIQKQELKSGEWEVTLKAKDMKVLMLGFPSFSKRNAYESVKSAEWRVDDASYSEFLEAHDFGSDASSWAGDGYVVSSVSSKPYGKLGHNVTVEARHVGVKMIDIRGRQTLGGWDTFGYPKVETVYTGKWQVDADHKKDFDGLVGYSAKEWAQDGFVAVQVDPVKLSDAEWEITIEARDPDSYNNQGRNLSDCLDDRSDLTDRVDVNPGVSEYRPSMTECGWAEKDGKPKMMPDIPIPWDRATQCPFVRTDPLPQKYFQRPTICMTVELTRHIKGDPRDNFKTIQYRFSAAEQQIKSGFSEMSESTGSWLRRQFSCVKIFDNHKKPWTKIVELYMQAPDGMRWNPTYWQDKGTEA